MALTKRFRLDFTKISQQTGSTAALCAAPVVTAAALNTFDFGGQTITVYNDAQNDDVCFTRDATLGGWTIPNDNTDNDGIEINPGIGLPSNGVFVVGTDPAFYMQAKFVIPDVSDYDVAAAGFRKAAANAACSTPAALATAYTDSAVINCEAGDHKTVTSLNTATDVTTDITNAANIDGDTITYRVDVSATGVTTYTVNGVAAAGAVAFTFDTGDSLIPFVRFTKGAAAADTPPCMLTLEWGYA